MKYDRLIIVAALAAIPAVALGQNNPANIDSGIVGKNLQKSHEDVQLPASVWYDSLWIVNTDVVDSGNGSAISGMSIFGVVYDLSMADDFSSPGGTCTSIVHDYLNFNGGAYAPATDYLIEFFGDAGGAPNATASTWLTGTSYAASTINVGWWGPCTRITSKVKTVLCRGMHWVSPSPVDTTSTGDWYYGARKYATGFFGDAHGRDGGVSHGSLYGGPYGGGYGTSSWTSMGTLGYTAGDWSMQVNGTDTACCGSFDLTISGNCNTSITVALKNGIPGASVAFAYGSNNTGSTPIPRCPGLAVCIGNARAWGPNGLVIVQLDAVGEWSFVKTGGASLCNKYVQAVDLSNCQLSNIQAIPG